MFVEHTEPLEERRDPVRTGPSHRDKEKPQYEIEDRARGHDSGNLVGLVARGMFGDVFHVGAPHAEIHKRHVACKDRNQRPNAKRRHTDRVDDVTREQQRHEHLPEAPRGVKPGVSCYCVPHVQTEFLLPCSSQPLPRRKRANQRFPIDHSPNHLEVSSVRRLRYQKRSVGFPGSRV